MTRDLSTLWVWIHVCLIVAAICTTAFPVLYAFSPWYSRLLGRLVMLQAVVLAAMVDLTLLFQFWHIKNVLVAFWINAIMFSLVAVSSAALTLMLLKLRYNYKKELKMADENHQPEHAAPAKPFLSNKFYDTLKFIALIFLPAGGTLYFAVAQIWGLPYGPEVVGTIVAADTFLGTLLGLATKQYNNSGAKYDGEMVVQNRDDETRLFSLNLNGDPAELPHKQEVLFKVNPAE